MKLPWRRKIPLSAEEVEANREAAELQRAQARAARAHLLIIPDSPLLNIWQLYILGPIVIYIVVYMPIELMFGEALPKSDAVTYFDFALDGLFWLDIIINFRTAYKNEEDETIVVDLKKIAHRYVCGFRSGGGWFFVDLISSLPIQYIALISGNDEGKESGSQIRLFKVLRLLRLARLLRLLRIRALTRQYEDTALFDVFGNLKLVHMTFLIMWMAHIAACVW